MNPSRARIVPESSNYRNRADKISSFPSPQTAEPFAEIWPPGSEEVLRCDIFVTLQKAESQLSRNFTRLT
jgi:hypothetical protein